MYKRLGISNGEVWHEVSHLGWMPEGIYHAPDQSFNPKFKLKQRKRQKDYASIPEYKASRKEYYKKQHSTPEFKTRRKEYMKKYRSIPENKARKKEYDKRRYRRNKK